MSNIDYSFLVEMLGRYHKHLESVVGSLETYQEHTRRHEAELKRLVQFKPEVYSKELKKAEKKLREADIKLSFIVPRMDQIRVQMAAISVEKGLNIVDINDRVITSNNEKAELN